MATLGKHTQHAPFAGHGRRRLKGFTLLELMIVVAIVAILAAIALSSYGFANVKARRGAAKGCLEQSAQYMERYYTTNFTYVGAKGPADVCDAEVLKYYDFPAPTLAATTYILTAQPTSNQDDSVCGTLTLDQVGTKTPSTEGCW